MDEEQNLPPTAAVSYRVRLRFRVQKKLNVDATERRFEIAGREVVLSPAMKDVAIRDSEWLVMNARGLPSEEEARQFGQRLRIALEVSSIATRLGVDAGRDLATSSLAQSIRESIERETGALVRNNIHGLDVFPDDPNTCFFTSKGPVPSSPALMISLRA